MTVRGVVGKYQQFESIYILLLQGTLSSPVRSEGKKTACFTETFESTCQTSKHYNLQHCNINRAGSATVQSLCSSSISDKNGELITPCFPLLLFFVFTARLPWSPVLHVYDLWVTSPPVCQWFWWLRVFCGYDKDWFLLDVTEYIFVAKGNKWHSELT
jgi:hypothetical protein